MKRLILCVLFSAFSFYIFSQIEEKTNQPKLPVLSSKQILELSSLPELKLPSGYKNKSIPYEVDNTIQTCYSGLFLQDLYSCGQAACVANGFTYEINRVRGLDGSLVQNKYPTHFAWNWENGGGGYSGASYYHSMLLLKKVGSPNMQTYGGAHNTGGEKRWMTGYDSYYAGMHNRISKAKAIKCNTEEGILTLKHWLNDHLDGSDVGGIAFFYSQYQNPSTNLPDGTEHAGEKVCISWGASPNHGLTITGYNDSIRWDYNGDGQYTNNIDITDDGIVDVRDWEIGGFKMCNTYSTPYNGWMMYRTLALASTEGGIWNNTVNVLFPIKEYSPSLTAKVRIYYTNRWRIKIIAGYSTNISASEPDYYMTFPIVDYQGGELGMQGASDEASREIELGLDITPFLNIIPSATPVKFFFQVHETDPEGWGSGYIRNFSVIDYTSGSPVEYVSGDVNVSIIHNSVTTVSVNHTPVFNKPEITTDVLPTANVYHQYSHQMEASGGSSPYRWEFDQDYTMTEISTAIPVPTTELTGTLINLPFDFPFYGETYNYFYLTNTGLIDFSGETYSLPYNNNSLSNYSVRFLNRKGIAAFYSTTECSTYYSQDADNYIIRWVGTNIDVSLKLKSDGTVTIYYNNCSPAPSVVWNSGVSYGDLGNYILTPLSGSSTPISSVGYTFEPKFPPDFFSLSEEGLLTAVPDVELLAYPLNFKITDANGLINRKTIPISTEGLIIEYEVSTLDDEFIEWGETVNMNLDLRNATEETIHDLVLTLSCENPDVVFTDNTQNVGDLTAFQEMEISNSFVFNTNYNFYNGQEINLHLIAQAVENTWEFDIIYPVFTADIAIAEYFVDDFDNNRLDIDETSDVYYVFENAGGSELYDMIVTVSSSDPFISINDNYDESGDLLAGESINAYFNFTAHSDCPPGHVAILNFHIEGANNYEKDITGYITVDQILEDWETNSFDTYNWAYYGDEPWFITTELPYEGTYCLKSGGITHNENSTIAIELQVVSSGTISFFKKVSSETNYDFLKFYIDGYEKGSWSGEIEWSENTYSVSAGIHNFKWTYSKDVSVSTNSDCAWIDYIEFPSIFDADPELLVSHSEVEKTLNLGQTGTETINISNVGGGIINYEIQITDDVPWLRSDRSIAGSSMSCSEDSFYAGDTVEWLFTASAMSSDNEWIKSINMTFPSGFIIDSLTHFLDQSEDTLLLISGEPGDGGEFTWFGENGDGWGLITPNENAHATVFGHISEDFQDKMTIYYTLQGEIYGSEPHQVNDSIEMFNFGPRVNWLTVNPLQGDLGIGNEDEIVLNFNSTGLNPGIYTCDLRIYTNLENLVIPVELTVTNQVGLEMPILNDIKAYPNPTTGKVYFESESEILGIEVYTNIGQKIFTFNPKENRFEIDLGRSSAGIYFIKVITDSEIYNTKIIVQ